MASDIRSHSLPDGISKSSSRLIVFCSSQRYDINCLSIPGNVIYLETMNLCPLNRSISL